MNGNFVNKIEYMMKELRQLIKRQLNSISF